MVLERNRVDYVNGLASRRGRCTEEHTVDCFVRVFEGMKYEFGIGEVSELKAWARHAAKSSWRRPTGGIPGRDSSLLCCISHLRFLSGFT